MLGAACAAHRDFHDVLDGYWGRGRAGSPDGLDWPFGMPDAALTRGTTPRAWPLGVVVDKGAVVVDPALRPLEVDVG